MWVITSKLLSSCHGIGKSRTINRFVKPKLGIEGRQRRFAVTQRKGLILLQSREKALLQRRKIHVRSQSLEENGTVGVKDIVRRLAPYRLLVLAARPRNERPSSLVKMRHELRLERFAVHEVHKLKRGSDCQYRKYAEQVMRI